MYTYIYILSLSLSLSLPFPLSHTHTLRFFERHEGWSWVLQDILSVALCLEMLKNVRFSNIKVFSKPKNRKPNPLIPTRKP